MGSLHPVWLFTMMGWLHTRSNKHTLFEGRKFIDGSKYFEGLRVDSVEPLWYTRLKNELMDHIV